jgi:flagellar secretion chaperone FliS
MSGAHRYVAMQNTTASKERLMVNLFDTALKHMRSAIRLLEGKDRRAANVLIDKSSKIVSYLHGTLNPDAAPKLVDNLQQIYMFTIARLSRSIVTGKPADLREAERAFAPIADGFSQAVAAVTRPQTTAARP